VQPPPIQQRVGEARRGVVHKHVMVPRQRWGPDLGETVLPAAAGVSLRSSGGGWCGRAPFMILEVRLLYDLVLLCALCV
jgi:hypothetical protein